LRQATGTKRSSEPLQTNRARILICASCWRNVPPATMLEMAPHSREPPYIPVHDDPIKQRSTDSLARELYEILTGNTHTERIEVNRAWYVEDVAVIEHQWTSRVPGEFLGTPTTAGRSLSACYPFGELTEGRMRCESAWLEATRFVAQLTPPEWLE
jgi:hypothetical protein